MQCAGRTIGTGRQSRSDALQCSRWSLRRCRQPPQQRMGAGTGPPPCGKAGAHQQVLPCHWLERSCACACLFRVSIPPPPSPPPPPPFALLTLSSRLLILFTLLHPPPSRLIVQSQQAFFMAQVRCHRPSRRVYRCCPCNSSMRDPARQQRVAQRAGEEESSTR
jgi:hypothetical protein